MSMTIVQSQAFYRSATVKEEMTSKSILKYIGLTERSHHPSTTANGCDSEEVEACGVIRFTFCHVEFASRSIVLVAFPSDSFCLIVFSGDAFNIVSDIFAVSFLHKGGLFVTASHGGPLVCGENSCQYDLGSLESGLPHAEPLPISSKLIYSFLPPVPLTYVVSLS